jgi:hypothetical protein
MALTPLERPDTATGVVRFVVVPSPSWPALLSPQHFTAPFWMAHAPFAAAEMAVTPLERPDTATGVVRFVVVPSPI